MQLQANPVTTSNCGSGKSGNRSASRGRGGRGGRNNRGHSYQNSSLQNSSTRPCCQICNRTGHTTFDCYHRMDFSYQGSPPSQLAAMTTSFSPEADQTWYADSGATSHMTNDLQNLSIHSNYKGKEKVAVGNGQGLHISNIGSSIANTSSGSFQLNNILHFPHISSNLLSVHQFTKDTNCQFIFYSNGFTIQDLHLKRILF